MKNILITGANGQLGNEMRLQAAENPSYTCFFTDVAELDICDEQAVMEYVTAHQIDVIVNCAAYTAVDKAEDNQELCDRLNHWAPGYLARAAASRGGAFIQVSTDYVFDGTAHIPYREDDTTCPNSVYGSTKLAGEEEALKYCSQTMVIRTAWLYSTFGNNFVKTMLRLGRERETLGVIFDQIGTPTYARDLATAIWTAIRQGIVPGIYHFSNFIIGRTELSGKAGSEKRIDYDIRSAEKFIVFFAVEYKIQRGYCRLDNAVIHLFCFIASGDSAAENDYYDCAFFKKFSCNNNTVAAVVSASAKNHKIASHNV